jgi:hypothetical protein
VTAPLAGLTVVNASLPSAARAMLELVRACVEAWG